ncbi:RpiR family transcriptional regulator [Pseudoclavibacter endophyticus]|uniref:MurR/RpiR family transcriptional regulator n=1 Tax=Pseudoclavibacter endophyticus TaxID=1778590 RepID=A0A6H9WIF7_9MICO|nr:MurR/RpiR family transcriptional regulator [Pseudoclavibacter endophyticus]KAB1648287.1 MurR/RpiR family transcriptional regulator [Pseudoclavibacter endophyticus]GGA71346.1 RpiR family transcriptional regulator [Pseudoclavibacter endophyticus]
MPDASPATRIAAIVNTLRPAERRVVEVIREHPELVIELTAQQLADHVGVARTSIVRTCQSLGYNGYAQLRVALARHTQAGERRRQPAAEDGSDLDVMRAGIAELASRLPQALELLDANALCRAIDLVIGARRLLCLANGLSASLAEDVAARLTSVGRATEHMTDPISQQVTARHLTPDDVVLIISGSGANHQTVLAARAANRAGATIIAITSFESSPLVDLADVTLVIASVSDTFRDELEHTSRVVHAVFLDGFVERIRARLGERGRAARDLTIEVLAANLDDGADR